MRPSDQRSQGKGNAWCIRQSLPPQNRLLRTRQAPSKIHPTFVLGKTTPHRCARRAHTRQASHAAVCSLNRGAAEAIGSLSVWCGLRATQENTLRVLQACGLTPPCPSSWPLLIGESGYTCFGILSWKAARCYGIFCATATAAVVSPDSSVISSWLPSSHVPLSACLMKRLRGNDTQAICTTS